MNCSQIFCTFAVETTASLRCFAQGSLWIALKFFVLLQSKQLKLIIIYKFSVVNCSQIFCTFAVETTLNKSIPVSDRLWIALKFFVLLQSKQLRGMLSNAVERLWIALKFFVLLQSKQPNLPALHINVGCELLSNFLYFCSRNNRKLASALGMLVVNCSQIFCTFAVETTRYA